MTLVQDNTLSFNLEPTFRCNLGCEMCPRFSSEDPHLDMSMDTYARIHAAMGYAHTVDFTGWGEPMLHPEIYNMIRAANDQGCVISMTSNGTILNRKNSLSLISAGMDRLTISVDGMTPQTFDAIRLGASFEQITRNLKQMSQLIQETQSSLELAVAFTIQHDNASELPLIVPWMRSVGSRVLHLKQLNVLSHIDDWERSFLKHGLASGDQDRAPIERLEKQIEEVLDRAQEAGIKVLVHSEFPMTREMKGRHCLATPLESVYFSYEGRVAPCCHFGHHVSRYFEAEYYSPSALFFGDIREKTFREVWEDDSFQSFRRGFVTQDFPEACKTCYLLYGK